MSSEKVYTHESYGLAGIGRKSGGFQSMFGSSLRHHDATFRLTIREGQLIEEEGCPDRYIGGSELIVIELTAAQMFEMFTNHNVNFGVPVTIRRRTFGGEYRHVEEPPSRTPGAARVIGTFKRRARDIGEVVEQRIAAAKAALPSSISKKRRADISSLLDSVAREASLGAGHLLDLFEEAVQRRVHEVKTEVDAAITDRLRAAGIEQERFAQRTVLLIEDNDKE